jgi:aminoglycoside N3'-acetyltransferase
MVAAITTPAELTRGLHALGEIRGRVMMVHASLRAIGPVRGGAVGVIEAVQEALGPDGTMLMMVAADDGEPFDRLCTPADPDNGVLAEVFRTHPGVVVNDNPACRFAAVGPAAAALIEPQPLHDYYGPGSPLERLYEMGGAVLRLGASVDTVTLTHYAEYLAEVPAKRRVERRYERADIGEIVVSSLDDTDRIAHWEPGDYFSQILIDFLDQGRASRGRFGRRTAELLDARQFVAFATDWMERELIAR